MSYLVCYCFGFTEEDIKNDFYNINCTSTILQKIVEEKKAGNCKCSLKNPKGT